MGEMLKISSNPKVSITIEADFTFATKFTISVLNCDKLEKRAFLMRELFHRIRSDLNKTQNFLNEQNSKTLF